MTMSPVEDKLAKYFYQLTGVLPEALSSAESTRLLILFFGTVGLDLLSCSSQLDSVEIINWVYDHQICSDNDCGDYCGFRGSSYIGYESRDQSKNVRQSPYDCSHITMVYNALCILITLGDDFSQVDRLNLLKGIVALQCPDEPGLFRANLICPERDMRFVYSAVASCYMLDGLDVLDKHAILSFIDRSYTYEGGFAQLPGLEAHAGATYCALATLTLLDSVNMLFPIGSRRRDRLIKWLVALQTKGFHGRMHKPDDTCYTFWVCASLKLLGCESLVNKSALLEFTSSAWDEVIGGIRKFPAPSYPPDPLHTYLCLSGLSCLKTKSCTDLDDNRVGSSVERDGEHELEWDASQRFESFRLLLTQSLCPVRPELNITESAFIRLKQLHQKWRSTGQSSNEANCLPDNSKTLNCCLT